MGVGLNTVLRHLKN
ncbi:TPA: hypothetical protein RRX42_004991, partial [Klebsiella pneumoniae]|nr:hypothetical protein [Klebsiella pneumoniae]HBR3548476.1 hypothetical protein [Klebsiella pneumoniae]HBT8644258.1 hypothetical protein [Klebsiella pneumoniae]HBT9313215.1 hypothetical protein [Klebsiella pneumoniae]HBT9392439.1 hypothetical protein [Klebsiella pneumoniae]